MKKNSFRFRGGGLDGVEYHTLLGGLLIIAFRDVSDKEKRKYVV